MFDNKSKLFKERENDAITIIENRVGFFKRFFLRDEKSIVKK